MKRFLIPVGEQPSTSKSRCSTTSTPSTATVSVDESSSSSESDYVTSKNDDAVTETACDISHRNKNVNNSGKTSSRKRKHYEGNFRHEWTQTFKWLKLTEAGEKFCVICNKTLEGAKSHLQRHGENETHKKKSRAVSKTQNVQESIQNLSSNMSLNIKKAELQLCMGFLVEHNCAIRVMDHVPKLMKICFPDSKIAAGLNCARTKATNILHNMKEEAQKKLISHLRTQHFSVIADEVTDISVNKCLVILTRFVKEKKIVKDQLLALITLENSTSEGISDGIINLLKEFQIPLPNLTGFGADNCLVMMGNFKGVQAKLKEVCPNIFVTGCICHSLHLCASYAAKKLPSEVEEFVRNIYNYISRSPKRLKVYTEFQEFHELKPHKLLRVSQTRWLSLEAVVIRVLEQYTALQQYFLLEVTEEEDLEIPKKILESFNHHDIELYLTFLAYVLPQINKINRLFQSEKSQLHIVYESIVSLYKTVLKNFMKSQYVDQKEAITQVNPLNVNEYLSNNNIYVGENTHSLIGKYGLQPNQLISFFNNCLAYYVELSLQIRTRFQNLENNYKNLSLLNPKVLMAEPCRITPLLQQFNHFIDNDNRESISSEIREICNLPNDLKTKLSLLEFDNFWFELYKLKNSAGDHLFQNISNFVFKIMTIPHSSAAAKRIFSQLNLIKSKVRNRLLPETCNSILMSKSILCNNEGIDVPCYHWTPSKELLLKSVKYK